MNIKKLLKKYKESLSYQGLVMATLFFVASLSPSLLPRPYFLQGLLSGLSLFLGYALGLGLMKIWNYAELPTMKGRPRFITRIITTGFCLIIILITLVYSNLWQNDLRELMGLSPDMNSPYVKIGLIALLLFTFLLLVSRFIGMAYYRVKNKLARFIPRRIANVLSVTLVLVLFLFLADGLIIKGLLSTMDKAYALSDTLTDEGVEQPNNLLSSGSLSSLIPWDSLGRTGQNFIVNGPDQSDIIKFHDENSLQPLRVYVGLRSANTVEARADLALKELIRIGGFERSQLIIATPTGTGWLDPSALDPLEYMHQGDTAIVTMQYSYLSSWLTLLVDPSRSKVSARALYNVIYDYWITLDKNERPKLYLFGLSLGSLGAETSIDLASLLRDPIQGAVLAGPPFPSTLAPRFTQNRNSGSAQWLPIVEDSSFVRFTAQENALPIPGAKWGPVRIVYIQYASDPMVFFSPDLYRKEPEWLKGERGPDISPNLKWIPLVTFFQVFFDLIMADQVPKGNAHNYSASSYIDAWLEVSEPVRWSELKTRRLKKLFEGL